MLNRTREFNLRQRIAREHRPEEHDERAKRRARSATGDARRACAMRNDSRLLGAGQRCGILANGGRRKTAKTNRKLFLKNNLRPPADERGDYRNGTPSQQGKFTMQALAAAGAVTNRD
jgi:hypothetical protein